MIAEIVTRMEPLMRWLRRRRRRPPRRVRMVAVPGAKAEPMAPPPPTLRELVEVIGVGKTETVNNVSLTLLSLERYREGDIVTFRLVRKRGLHRDFPSPELFITTGPAAATATPRFAYMSGGGGGGMDEIVYRYSFGYSPGMPDGASDWVIEVMKIEWVRPYRSPERRIWSIDHGPWRFVIKP